MEGRRCYIVSYDLKNGDSSDYEDLLEAIKSYGKWAHITESTWALVTQEDASDIFDNLTQHMKAGDRLFVVRSGVESAWSNVICHNEWLKKNL